MHKISPLYVSGLVASAALIGSVSSIALEVHPVPLGIFILSMIAGTVLDRRSSAGQIVKPIFLLACIIVSIVISIKGMNEENLFYRALGILLIIVSAKLISQKRPRDIMQLFLLNFFVVAGSAVTRLDIEFALLIVGEAFLSILGLVLVYGSSEQDEIPVSQVWQLVRWSGVVTVILIPATVIIFLIIPRPSRTFLSWGGGVTAKSGFSDTVTPGAVEQIKIDRSPAFRAKWISGKRPAGIYWRGMIYDSYSQGAWERSIGKRINVPGVQGRIVEYEVVLEPNDTRYLPSISIPFDVSGKRLRASIVSGYTVEMKRSLSQRIIYRIKSYIVSEIPNNSPPGLFLDIPDELQAEIGPLAESLSKDTVYETAFEMEKFLKESFAYDLSPGEPDGDPVLYFLTKSQKGHCEYFASSMTLLLRSLGIPARMVGGYLEGEWNSLGQYYLVRQSDAHTWVEVWVENRGWVVFDPTPSSSLAGSPFQRSRIVRMIDFLRFKWYYWVLDYNINRQLDLVRKSTSFLRAFQNNKKSIDIKENLPDIKYIIALAVLIGLIVAATVIRRYIQAMPKSWGERFVNLMMRHGFNAVQGETVMEFALRTVSGYPAVKTSVLNFVNRYYAFEYGGKGDARELAGYLEAVKKDLKGDPTLL